MVEVTQSQSTAYSYERANSELRSLILLSLFYDDYLTLARNSLAKNTCHSGSLYKSASIQILCRYRCLSAITIVSEKALARGNGVGAALALLDPTALSGLSRTVGTETCARSRLESNRAAVAYINLYIYILYVSSTRDVAAYQEQPRFMIKMELIANPSSRSHFGSRGEQAVGVASKH